MDEKWKEDVYLKRAELAQRLHPPMAWLAALCAQRWEGRSQLNDVLASGFEAIPHASYLYVIDDMGVQVSDSIGAGGIGPDHYGLDRSQRPYLREPVPSWGFLLSDAYVSPSGRPSLTALHVVRDGETVRGYLGAAFDLRNLPTAAAAAPEEHREWRQIKGDPSIRGTVFLQMRVESPMDRQIEQAMSILEELITERGMFQAVIHFSSSRATGWFVDDPFRYRIFDHEALADPDVCMLYPPRPWPADAVMGREAVKPILDAMRELRITDQNIYLRSASINIFNGMVSLTFSCDGSHYVSWDQLLNRQGDFWSSIGG